MSYRSDFSSVAKAEADAAFLSFSQFTAPDRAQAWYQCLNKVLPVVRILHICHAAQWTCGTADNG
jgi:hypothetical protein